MKGEIDISENFRIENGSATSITQMMPAIAIHLLVEAEVLYNNLATSLVQKSEFLLGRWEPNMSDFRLSLLATTAEVETWPDWKKGGSPS